MFALICASLLLPAIESYLLVVKLDKNLPDHFTLANLSVRSWEGLPPSGRHYKFEKHSLRLFHVSPTGLVTSHRRRLDCRGTFYPNPFQFRVTSSGRDPVEHLSVPLRVFLVDPGNVGCGSPSEVKAMLGEFRNWGDSTVGSVRLPAGCFNPGQFLMSLDTVLPGFWLEKHCRAHKVVAEPDKWGVEPRGLDLIVSPTASKFCISPEEEYFSPVKIHLSDITCEETNHNDTILASTRHTLSLILYHQQPQNQPATFKRLKRELQNQSPHFDLQSYSVRVPEEREKGYLVTTLNAVDPEGTLVGYSMSAVLDARSQSLFSIDARSGVVMTAAKLDREAMDQHFFRVTAIDGGQPPMTATTILRIYVDDVNDHAPLFEQASYETKIRESVAIGTTALTVRARDQDAGDNGKLEYSLLDTTDFRIDAKTGVITTRLPLDRESKGKYDLVVTAVDKGGTDRQSSTVSVTVVVLDDNDNYPQFEAGTSTVSVVVPENVDYSSKPVVASVRATDKDSGENGVVRYTLIGGNAQGQFSIDSLTGDLSVVDKLDYETTKSYRLIVRAQDGGVPSKSNTTQVVVDVSDVNDNEPRFFSGAFHETVHENVAVGYSVLVVKAFDGDDGVNAAVRYSVRGLDTSAPFTIDTETGAIVTNRDLDREETDIYQFTIVATDGGSPPLSASAQVRITVQDQNDNDPVFDKKVYEGRVSESDPPGTPVATVTASDPDAGSRLHYAITGGNARNRFSISTQNGQGVVSVAQGLDYRQENRFVLSLTATDDGGRSDTATLYVNVTDANTHAPSFQSGPYSATVLEDTPVGSTVLIVTAIDGDVGENAWLTYMLVEGDGEGDVGEDADGPFFTVNPSTGAVVTLRKLDRETRTGYLLTVTARDNGTPPLSDATDVEILVADVNDNSPKFTQTSIYTAEVSESAEPGTTVVKVSAVDADEELNGQVVYELRPVDGGEDLLAFDIDAVSGVVRTAKMLDRESVAVYHFLAVALDRGTPQLSSTASVVVKVLDENDSPPVFESDRIELRIPENSRIGTPVGTITARDPDAGENGRVQYSIVGGPDAESFSLDTETNKEHISVAVLRTRVDLDYESRSKEYNLIVRASSPPLRNDVAVRVLVEDVNDNAPELRDFRLIFNNYDSYFPAGAIGRVPASDADVTDKLTYQVISGNKAGLLFINATNGEITLSPALNTNVPIDAEMRVSVTDGLNTVEASLSLFVRLVTPEMLYNSVTLRLSDVTAEAFLDPQVYDSFVKGLAGIIPCPVENVVLFNIQDDFDGGSRVLNISFTARRGSRVGEDDLFSQQYLQDKVYLNRGLLSNIAGFQVLPFSDDLCAQEPCPNFQRCFVVLKFANAAGFLSSASMLFRPIYPVSSHACQCPAGFTGMREHYECNTEVNLCYSNPCGSSGNCLQKEGGYVCVCAAGFTGKNCEINLNLANECPTDKKPKTIFFQQEEPLCRGDSYCQVIQPTTNRPTSSGNNGARSRHVANKVQSSGRGLICANCTHSQFYSRFCHLTARSFSFGSYLTFPGLDDRFRLNLKLKFATRNPNGLLLFNGRYDSSGDFVALELIKGGLRFSFSLGDPKRVETVHVGAGSASPGLDDGQWHTVAVEYHNRTVKLVLDECDSFLALKYAASPSFLFSSTPAVAVGRSNIALPLGNDDYHCANTTTYDLEPRCSSETELCQRFLDLTGPLQLGGLPEELLTSQTNNNLPVEFYNFSGCISDVEIDHQLVDLNDFVFNNGTKAGCEPKMSFCSSDPCQRGGKCLEGWGTYVCECPAGWGGKDCSSEVAMPKQFLSEDSLLILKPAGNLRPIQLPWHLGVAFRTRNAHGVLMAVAIGGRKKAILQLRNGRLEFLYDDGRVQLPGSGVSDGNWHQAEVTWMAGGKIWVSLDYGAREATGGPIRGDISGVLVESVALGGVFVGEEDEEASVGVDFGLTKEKYFVGCLKDVKVGGDSMSLDDPLIPSPSVIDGCGATDSCSENSCPNHSSCFDQWNAHSCQCKKGFVGPNCFNICDLNPCANGGACVLDSKTERGYRCECSSPLHSGRYCEQVATQPCPTHWWGYPVCGPCSCPTDRGYSAECDKVTGACQCERNHFRPNGSSDCLPCDCYSTGSFGGACEAGTGQCRCRDGVIGRRCDSCANPQAEVTVEGCDVIYTGCPRSFAAGLLWERTVFGQFAVSQCPSGSEGQASRFCDPEQGWMDADTFNCTSEAFVDLARQLALIERGGVQLSSYSAVRAAQDLRKAANSTKLHGSDILISAQLLGALFHFEMVRNLNLTHRKDKDYIKNLVESMDIIVDPVYEQHWTRVRELTGSGLEVLLALVSEYGKALAISLADVYTKPFEIVTDNMVFGLDVLDVDSLNNKDGSSMLPTFVGSLGESGGEFLLPKYDNFVRKQDSWFKKSHFKLKLDWSDGKRIDKRRAKRRQVVFSYAFFHPSIGTILPAAYSRTVKRRWGLGLQIGSPLAIYHVHYPFEEEQFSGTRKSSDLRLQIDGLSASRMAAGTPQCVWWSGEGLEDNEGEVGGSVVSSYSGGRWSKEGCRTTIYATWEYQDGELFVDCSCLHAQGPMAVLVDKVEPEYVLQVGFTEEISVWIGVGGSVVLLFSAAVCLFVVVLADSRSGSRTSNAAVIHAHVVLCSFMAITAYLLALKLRVALLRSEFGCKFMAMMLHYLWMSVFSWMLVDSLHVYRMLTEMRDVNHGGMRVYLALGYGGPAVVTALSVGVRAGQYGTVYFCWLSMYESVIWSLVGPICAMIVASLVILSLAFRAFLHLKGQVDGFGNLRLLLWLCVGQVPLMSITWAMSLLAVDAASSNLSTLHHTLSISSFVSALYLFVAYCILNLRTRKMIGSQLATLFPCCCPKVGQERVEEVSAVVGRGEGGLRVVSQPSRTTRRSGRVLTVAQRAGYGTNDDFRLPRRGFGISTSSTTSRSTCKTSSSPYRTQLRNASTSSMTDSQACKTYDCESSCCDTGREKSRKGWRTSESEEETWDEETRSYGHRRVRREEGLASSHSSDEEETVVHNNELVVKEYKSQPGLDVNLDPTGNYDLGIPEQEEGVYAVPRMRPVYSTQWTSQLPVYSGLPSGQNQWYPSPTDRLSTSDNEFQATNGAALRPGSLRLNLPPGLDGVNGGSIVVSPGEDSPGSVPAVPAPMSALGTATTGFLHGHVHESVNDLSGDDSSYPRRSPVYGPGVQNGGQTPNESDDNETPV